MINRICRTRGIPRPEKTSSGKRRSPDSRTRARSCGATRSSSPARSRAEATRRSSPASTATATPPTIDRSQRWMLYAIDKRTGKIRWERIASQGEPQQQAPHQVHVRKCIARHRRTHRRRVVRIAGHSCLRFRRRLALVGRSRPRRHGRVRHSCLRVGTGQLADRLERPGDRAVRHAGGFVPARAQRRNRRDGVEDRSQRAAVVGHADDRHDAGRSGAHHQRVELRARLRSEDGPRVVEAWRQLEDHGADADLRRRVTPHRQRTRSRSVRSSRCGPARAAT